MTKEIRQLNDDEKKLAQKVVDGHEAEKKHVELMIRYNTFMEEEMLESNYLDKKREFKRQTENLKNELKELQTIIDITSKQIKDGVKVKEECSQNEEVPKMVK